MATLDSDDLAAIAALFTDGTMEIVLKRFLVSNNTEDVAFRVSNNSGPAVQFSSGGGDSFSLQSSGGAGLSIEGGLNWPTLVLTGSQNYTGGLVELYGGNIAPAIAVYGPYTTPGPAILISNDSSNSNGSVGGHGISIISAGAGNHDIALLGSGDIEGTISLDLTQALSDVKTATVGGALNGAHAIAWGKIIKDVGNKLLKIFSFGSLSVPKQVFDLDDGTNPTTRTPQ